MEDKKHEMEEENYDNDTLSERKYTAGFPEGINFC